MPWERPFGFVLVALLLYGSGCATGLRASSRALREGDPTRAALLARESLAQNDQDIDSWRDLGIARYQLDRPGEALESLDRVLAFDPYDRQALLFRARALDALGRVPEALAAYGDYLPHGRGGEVRIVRARIEQLRRRKVEAEIERAIAREDSLSTAATPKNSVAVPDFVNPAESDTLRPVAKGLAVMTTTDLARVETLRVLERQRLTTLLEELRRTNPEEPESRPAAGQLEPVTTILGQQQRLSRLTDPATGNAYYRGNLDGLAGPRFEAAIRLFQHVHSLQPDGATGPETQAAMEASWNESFPVSREGETGTAALFDASTAPRIGRLLRAEQIVQGAVLPIGKERVELSATLQNTSPDSGAVEASSAPVQGSFGNLLVLQKQLVFQILDLLGVGLTDRERHEIEKQQTNDLQAFLAFCRGLDYEDRGLVDEAITQYRLAFGRDARFSMAGDASATLSVGAADFEEIETSAVEDLPGVKVDAGKRALKTAKMIDLVPGIEETIGIDARTPDDQRPPGEGGTGTIVVEGDLPEGGKK